MTPEQAKEMNEDYAMENGNQLAFPFISNYAIHEGLTKREWMATQLMAGMLAQGIGSDVAADCSVRAVDNLLITLHVNERK